MAGRWRRRRQGESASGRRAGAAGLWGCTGGGRHFSLASVEAAPPKLWALLCVRHCTRVNLCLAVSFTVSLTACCLPACLPACPPQEGEAAPELSKEEYDRLLQLVTDQEQGLR